MINPFQQYPKNINAADIVILAQLIAQLEDEFKICKNTKQHEKAAQLEQQLGRLYRRIMHEVKRGLISIDMQSDQVKVQFRKSSLQEDQLPERQLKWLQRVQTNKNPV